MIQIEFTSVVGETSLTQTSVTESTNIEEAVNVDTQPG